MEVWEFGDFTLDAGERRLSRAGAPIPLAPKTFDVLLALARAAGRLVTKRDLLDRVWAGCFVEENILAVHVTALRKALGDGWIETAPRVGYRLSRAPVAPKVLELCERGRAHLAAASMDGAPRAVEAFRSAVELDPSYAAAHAGLALAWRQQAQFRLVAPAVAHERAKSAALRALAMEPASPDAQAALGTVLFLSEWNAAAAERSFRRALDLDPGHVEACLEYGSLLEARAEFYRGLELKRRALAHTSDSPLTLLAISMSYWYQRRWDDAIEWADRALAVDPRHLLAREHLAGAYLMKGDPDRHMRLNLEHAETYGAPREMLDALSRLYAAGGRAAVIRYAIEHAPPAAHLQLAILRAETGDRDAAFRHLDAAIDARDPCMAHLAVSPQWDPLRADPRFAAAVARIGITSVSSAASSG